MQDVAAYRAIEVIASGLIWTTAHFYGWAFLLMGFAILRARFFSHSGLVVRCNRSLWTAGLHLFASNCEHTASTTGSDYASEIRRRLVAPGCLLFRHSRRLFYYISETRSGCASNTRIKEKVIILSQNRAVAYLYSVRTITVRKH
jgi:hypothetical protein